MFGKLALTAGAVAAGVVAATIAEIKITRRRGFETITGTVLGKRQEDTFCYGSQYYATIDTGVGDATEYKCNPQLWSALEPGMQVEAWSYNSLLFGQHVGGDSVHVTMTTDNDLDSEEGPTVTQSVRVERPPDMYFGEEVDKVSTACSTLVAGVHKGFTSIKNAVQETIRDLTDAPDDYDEDCESEEAPDEFDHRSPEDWGDYVGEPEDTDK